MVGYVVVKHVAAGHAEVIHVAVGLAVVKRVAVEYVEVKHVEVRSDDNVYTVAMSLPAAGVLTAQ